MAGLFDDLPDAPKTKAPAGGLFDDIPTVSPAAPVEPTGTWTDNIRDPLAGVLKIGPTAVKGVADIARLITGDRVGGDLSDSMQAGMRSIDDLVGSERLRFQKNQVNQALQDDAVGITDIPGVLLDNPRAGIDMGISTIGSMFLPAGVATGAVRGAQALPIAAKLAPGAVATGATIGTGAVQNAAETFADAEGQALSDRYTGAGISGAASLVLGKLLGGGAEGVVARRLAGETGARGVAAVTKSAAQTGAKEFAQEFGEEGANTIGKQVAKNEEIDLEDAGKQGMLGGILGLGLGAGADAATNVGDIGRGGAERAIAAAIEQAGQDIADTRPSAQEVRGMFADLPDAPRAEPAARAPVATETAEPPEQPQPLALPLDPNVRNPQPTMVADAAGNVRPQASDEAFQAEQAAQAARDLGLTPDVQRAIDARARSPEPAPAPAPQDLIQRLMGAGWTPPNAQPQATPDPAGGQAPDQAAAPAGQAAASPAPAVGQPAAPGAVAQPEPPAALTGPVGVDMTPMDQGGKPFRTELAAKQARKLQPRMRVVRAPGGKGFVLAPKTEKQLAAEAQMAKRLRTFSSGTPGKPMSAHEFVVSRGGLDGATRADLGIEGNPRVGNRMLFAGKGKPGMTLEQAAMALREAGYITDELENTAADVIRRSLRDPQYTPEGVEQVAQAEQQAQYEDFLAAEQESDPLAPLTDEDLAGDPDYTAASPEIQAEVRALLAQAEALGIDTETLREDAARATDGQPEQAYYERTREDLTQAIGTARAGSDPAPAENGGGQQQEAQPRGPEDRGQDPGQASSEGLTAPTQQEIIDRLDRIEAAQKEQARADREAEQRDQADRQRREVAQRSQAAADTFELGQSAEDNLSGQQPLLRLSEPTNAVPTQAGPQYQPTADDQRIVSTLQQRMRERTGDTAYVLEPVESLAGNRELAAAIDLARRVFGVEAIVVRQPGRRIFNGAQLGGRLLIDENTAQPPMAVIGHELMHQMRKDRPDLYQLLTMRMRAVLRDNAEGSYGAQLNADYQGAGMAPLDADTITEELMADILGDRFGEPEFWNALAGRNPRRFADVVRAVRDFLTEILAKIRGNNPFGTDRYLTDVQAARDILAEVLDSYSQGEVATVDGDVRLSAARDTGPRDLIITHNLTAENLLFAQRQGGIPVPSLAVTKKGQALTGFGEITLLGPRELADPKGYAGTKVFGADIYSPRYPSVERELDRKAQAALQKKLQPMADRMGVSLPGSSELERDGQRELERNLAVMGTFLQQRGIEPGIVMRKTMEPERRARLEQFGMAPFMDATSMFDLIDDPAFIEAAVAEYRDAMVNAASKRDSLVTKLDTDETYRRNVARETANQIIEAGRQRRRPEADTWATRTALEKQIEQGDLAAEYQDFVADELKAITKSERIFRGFTNAGNRKYIPHTLDNVVKILKTELRGGEGFNYGVGSLRAKFTPQFKSVADVRKNRDRLVSDQQFEQVRKEIDDELMAVAAGIDKDLDLSTAVDILEEAAKVGVPRAAKGYGYEVSDAAAQRAAQFLTRLRNLPTQYFEAKVLRAVSLSEFRAAVVPDGVNPRAEQALRDAGVEIRTYPKGDETARRQAIEATADELADDVLFSIVRPTPPAAITPQPWNVSEPGTGDAFIRAVQNNKIDLKRVREAITAQYGAPMMQSDAYLAEELYHGKVAARVEELHREYVEPILAKIAVAGKNVGVTMDDVNTYLHARHAPERNAAMKAINPGMPNNDALSGMSNSQAANLMAAYKQAGKDKALALIAADIDKLLEDTRTALVADGLEEAGTVQAWEAAYQHYVPLQRDIKSTGTPKGMGFSVRGPESKRAVGSNREVVNILANIVAQAETAAIRAEKAVVGRTLLAMARAYPNPDFWKVDIPPTKPRIDPATGLVIRGAVDPLYQTADNVLMVKDYGTEHFIVFNQDSERAMMTARAMKNLGVESMNKVLQVIGTGTRFLASLLTQRNPLFWLTNFARDIQGAMLNLEGTDAEGLQRQVMANLGSSFKGMQALVRGNGGGQWARYARELKEAGGTTGYMQAFENTDLRMKDLEREVARMQQSKADPRRLGRLMLEFIDDYNDIIENAVRLSVFQAARDAGVPTPKAASIAKNITVNFNRKGNVTPAVNALYMFFNASIQGTARLAQAIVTSRKAQVAVGGITALGFMLDALNRAMSDDDEETGRNRYDLIPEFEKSKNWIFMNPMRPGEYVKIPLPLGPHVFHNAGRLVSDAMFRDDPRNLNEYAWAFANTLMGAFSPLGDAVSIEQLIAPSVADPVVQLSQNKSFTGAPVYKSADRGFGPEDPRPAYTRYFESTPDLWKQSSKLLNDLTGGDQVKPGAVNIEPDILKHVFYTLTGGPGRTIDQTIDTVQGEARGQDVTVNRLPLANRFYGANDDRQRERIYYDDRKKVAEAKAQFDHFNKSGRRDLAREVAEELGEGDYTQGLRIMRNYKGAETNVRKINAQIKRELERQANGEDRSEQLRALRQRRTQAMTGAVRETDEE